MTHPYAKPTYLDAPYDGTLRDHYYNMAYYYALGHKDGWKHADPFAAAFVRHVERQTAHGKYNWSVVDYYPEWKDNNA